MGYRIHYGHMLIKEEIRQREEKRKTRLPAKLIVACSIVLVITILGKTGCLDFLIPGDKEVTKQAFSAMVENVRDGEDVKSAITAFCVEILDHAELSQ